MHQQLDKSFFGSLPGLFGLFSASAFFQTFFSAFMGAFWGFKRRRPFYGLFRASAASAFSPSLRLLTFD
jgi:hypothetical protein